MTRAPLAGIRVLDLTKLLPGPFCTMILADLGAEVIKVEHPDPMKDMSRFSPPFTPGKARVGMLHYLINRNKQSITLNYRKPRGRKILLELVTGADVLVESFKPGTMHHWNLGQDVLEQWNPDLIYCSLSGYGQDGPRAGEPGHDLNYMALSGILHYSGDPKDPPACLPVPFGDYTGALFATIGILASLQGNPRARNRLQSQEGGFTRVDVSILESILALHPVLEGLDRDFRKGEMALSGEYPFYRNYECGDGKHIAIGAIEQKFWKAFCESMGHPEFTEQQFAGMDYLERALGLKSTVTRDEINETFEQIFATRKRQYWLEYLGNRGVCCSPVLSPSRTWKDQHVQARGVRVPVKDPRAGSVDHVTLPVVVNGKRFPISPAPSLGQDNDRIYDALGIGRDELRALRRERII